MTPADTMRAAARLLRERATAAVHEGRTAWRRGATLRTKSPVVVDDGDQPTVLIETWAKRLEDVNAYLELLGPAFGLAVAEWLDATAEYCRVSFTQPVHVGRAIAVARALLGEEAQ